MWALSLPHEWVVWAMAWYPVGRLHSGTRPQVQVWGRLGASGSGDTVRTCLAGRSPSWATCLRT